MIQRNLGFNPSDYAPQRFGLSYNPPQIIVEYLIPSSGKLYHHKIKFKAFSSDMNITDVLEDIYKKHKNYLNHHKVNKDQIYQLIKKLKEKYLLFNKLINTTSNEMHQKMISEVDDIYHTNEDMNKLSKEELEAKKKQMNILYEKHSVKVGDKDYQYDIRVSQYILNLYH